LVRDLDHSKKTKIKKKTPVSFKGHTMLLLVKNDLIKNKYKSM